MFNFSAVVSNDNTSELSLSSLMTSASATGESGGSWNLLWKKVITNSICHEQGTDIVWICGGVIYYSYTYGCYESTTTTTYTGKQSRCDDGWSLCLSGCEGAS